MKYIFWLAAIVLLPASIIAQNKPAQAAEIVASGGPFTLEKSVTAGGGIKKEVSPLNENGTSGQTVAGVRSTGGSFSLYSGFWTPDDFAPTAANAVLGGRILTAGGLGIRNAQVSITFPSGEIRTTKSSAFGYYRFAELPTGEIYIIAVAAKKYAFSQATQIRALHDDLQDVNFIADE
jgi:hypothetical protein